MLGLRITSMAEESLTTPGAVSRRFLFSVAAAAPVAAMAAEVPPNGVPASILALLDRYRDTGVRLREVEAARVGALAAIPLGFRPVTVGGCVSRWPEWTRGELEALGLPASMPLRPSANDFILYSKYSVSSGLDDREDAKRRHRVRLDAWHGRRSVQKEWFSRTGLDVINRRRGNLMVDKHRIERELMELMIGPDRAAIDA
jgi:hypothetical protein